MGFVKLGFAQFHKNVIWSINWTISPRMENTTKAKLELCFMDPIMFGSIKTRHSSSYTSITHECIMGPYKNRAINAIAA